MKGDIYLVPVVLESTDPNELSKMIVAERIRRNQQSATAHYVAALVPRRNGPGYMKYTAFVEFLVEEK